MTPPEITTRTIVRPRRQQSDHTAERAALCAIGRDFHTRGWSLGTSSNYSAVVGREPLRLLITASGLDKGRLGTGDFVTVDEQAKQCGQSTGRPSAETLLHTTIVRHTGAGAVLHTHSVWTTLLSDLHAGDDGDGELVLEDFEMLKGLTGITTHRTRVRLPIFDNTQDMAALACRLDRAFDNAGPAPSHGFLLRHHGLYTWGRDIAEARRHVEVLEFLFEVVGRKITITQAANQADTVA